MRLAFSEVVAHPQRQKPIYYIGREWNEESFVKELKYPSYSLPMHNCILLYCGAYIL
jgi:hypothetical protein